MNVSVVPQVRSTLSCYRNKWLYIFSSVTDFHSGPGFVVSLYWYRYGRTQRTEHPPSPVISGCLLLYTIFVNREISFTLTT